MLVVDLSNDRSAEDIDNKFRFWKTQIVDDPSKWRGGWSVDSVKAANPNLVELAGADARFNVREHMLKRQPANLPDAQHPFQVFIVFDYHGETSFFRKPAHYKVKACKGESKK